MSATRPALRVLDGCSRRMSRPATHTPRMLHPVSALARRAGITPVRVPDEMWVAPSLLALRPAEARERHLRAVA